MFASRVNTLKVPIIAGPLAGQSPVTPAVIVDRVGYDCVVRVRNNAYGQYVLIAFDASTLQTFPTQIDTWKLPAGQVDVFILAKGQSLFVSTPSGGADGSGVEISYQVFQNVPAEAGMATQL
jgi:hypothetical protein